MSRYEVLEMQAGDEPDEGPELDDQDANPRPRTRRRLESKRSEEEDLEEGGDLAAALGDQPDETKALGNGIYLAVVKQTFQDRIGAAYYTTDTETLFVGDFSGIDAFNAFKMRLSPGVIISSAKKGEQLYDVLSSNELDPEAPFTVITVKRSEFAYETAQHRLRLLHIEDLAGPGKLETRYEQTLHLSAVINLENVQVVSACGGLLAYLLKNKLIHQLEDAADPVSVRSLQVIPNEDILLCDAMTARALSVNVSELHPGSSVLQKEGLSLFGILNQTKTGRGAAVLRRWLMHPMANREAIERRLEHVAFFTLPQAEDFIAEVRTAFKHLKDVDRLLSKIKNVRSRARDWRYLLSSLQSLQAIHALAMKHLPDGSPEEDSQPLQLFADLQPLLTEDVLSVHTLINTVLELDVGPQGNHIDDGRIPVRAGVSEELDYLKRLYQGLGEFLTSVAAEDMKAGALPDCVTRLTIVYFPQLGYLLKVPLDVADDPTSIPDLEFQFKTDKHAFYKNSRTIELDEKFGDIQGTIADMEAAIVRELETRVLNCADTIRQLAAKAFEIDALIALALGARQYNLVRPAIVEESVLEIEEGVHPLQELCLEGGQFIPNDTNMGDPLTTGRLHLITGPNNSGKSVYLKQVGVIVYLAHCGSFVPAKRATIGLCDRILSRMRSVDSVSSSLSTFSADSAQMAYLLRHCTPRSLLLIDEFGKGTAAHDGTALLASVIKHLAERGAECPLTIVTTHFHELFTHRIVQQGPPSPLRFMRMSFLTKDMAIQSALSSPQGLGLGGTEGAGGGERSSAAAGMEDEPSEDSKQQPLGRFAAARAASNASIASSRSDSKEAAALAPLGVEDPSGELVFLYRLEPGLADHSYGLKCAAAAGMPDSVIRRAHVVSTRASSVQPIPLVPITRLERPNERMFEVFRKFVEIAEPPEDGTEPQEEAALTEAEEAKIAELIQLLNA